MKLLLLSVLAALAAGSDDFGDFGDGDLWTEHAVPGDSGNADSGNGDFGDFGDWGEGDDLWTEDTDNGDSGNGDSGTTTAPPPSTRPPSSSPGSCASFSGCKCGPMPNSPLVSGSRVIGGQAARQNGWPWLVRYSGGGSLCGASVIRLSDDIEKSDIVLSARHCHTSNSGNGAEVILGDHNLRTEEPVEVRMGIQEAITLPWHPEGYNGVSPGVHGNRFGGWGDIVVFKLNSPVAFTDAIQPLCLPAQGFSPADDTEVFLAGWGQFSNDPNSPASTISDTPQEIAMKKVNDGQCGIANATADICAKIGSAYEGACSGDSGGPLVYSDPANGDAFTITGIASYVSINPNVEGSCNVGGAPSVFTRVSSYVDWIKETVCAKSSFAAQLPYC